MSGPSSGPSDFQKVLKPMVLALFGGPSSGPSWSELVRVSGPSNGPSWSE